MPAVIERAEGEDISFSGSCSLGRAANNTVVISDKGVSRRHAVVHFQGKGEYLLVDLGSTNGTLLNNRYLHKPTLLKDRDRFQIAKHSFQFRCSPDDGGEPSSEDPSLPYDQKTVASIGLRECWLLVADIKGFTQMSLNISPEDLSRMVGRWLLTCGDVIEEHGGSINKYLGDGFLAYWFDTGEVSPQVAKAIGRLSENQNSGPPEFCMVIHYGTVALGGATSSGEESMLGPDLNFAFRMEKVASSANSRLMFSKPAYEHWPEPLNAGTLESELAGFRGSHLFYSVG